MSEKATIQRTFEEGEGILRLAPTFIPRQFSTPGKRLRLHPDDYFALGMKRGAIKERWFSSVIPALNGELAAEDEGMSYVAVDDDPKNKVLFKDFVDELKGDIIGSELQDKYGTWPMFSKFFDYDSPLFHHVHLTEEKAQLVGWHGKPESYYFPYQLNNRGGRFPVTYFGFDATTTKEQVMDCFYHYEDFDTRITELSRAYRIQLGTGWYVPPGIAHAPGSVLTYEPQWNSDCNSVVENVTDEMVNGIESLVENCPPDKQQDMDYVFSLLDWEKNVDPEFRKHYFRPPIEIEGTEGYIDKWISYGNDFFSAKELSVLPGQTVTIKDSAAYGCIIIQGFGSFGPYAAETAVMLRFGQLSSDEFFVSEDAAKRGVVITNNSRHEPMVILKHFGPNNTEAPGVPY